ncbi:hypothetical protein ACFODL_15730 [Phenylobacterium terrae]|uniref:DUF1176 domain-containing protein n=1 Tax=Phenylobacterium terrae TaxID=2665495 RepID=A0ABW4N6P8_9CAUL
MRVLSAVLVLLAGPALAAPTPAAAPAQAAAAPPVPKSVWENPAGDARHLQSGLRCPASMGMFARSNLITYDAFGLDVSCGYNAPGAIVTFFLYRRGDLDASFAEAEEQLAGSPLLNNPKEVADEPVDLGGLRWRRARYAEAGGRRADLWMAPLEGWTMKVRATYDDAAAEAVEAQIAALTQGALASAGAQLKACAKAPPPERTGRPVKHAGDEAAADALVGALLGAVAQAAAQEGRAEPRTPILFCAEAPIEDRAWPMLAWRGVTPDGEDAKVDRLSAMTLESPPVLETAEDAELTLIFDEQSRRSDPRWVARLQQDGRTAIFGHYDGRPSAATLAPLLLDILDGKARPLGAFSDDGRTVTIIAPPDGE